LCAVGRLADDDPGKDVSRVPDRTLILVRHGQYDMSTGKLTQLGRLVTFFVLLIFSHLRNL